MVKKLIKSAAFQLGGFKLWHRSRNRDCLSVLMFHRVLPQDEMERLNADPLYTVTPELLGQVAEFLKRYYTPVGLEDVLASREGIRPLPPYPVLITFDDGWRDNLDYAAPVLEKAGMPWVLFAATEAVSAPESWWQEVLQWALRSERVSYDELWAAASGNGDARSSQSMISLLLRYGALSDERRTEILEPFAAEMRALYGGDLALGADGLRLLRKGRVGIGAHGSSHLPLALVDRAEKDIAMAKSWLSEHVDVTTEHSISFPHGRYDARALRAARDAGYRLLFTSDPVLNPCPRGWLASDLLGRIPISTHSVVQEGRVAGEKIAPWLFLRDRQAPYG